MKNSQNTKYFYKHIFLGFILILTLCFLILLNYIIFHISLIELSNNVLDFNRDHSYRDFIMMAAKYKLQMQLYNNQLDEDTMNLEELKIYSIIAKNEKNIYENLPYNKYLSYFNIFLVNPIRLIFGEDKMFLNQKTIIDKYLDTAYYYEKNKLYKIALEIYNESEKKISKNNYKYFIIQLHQGFCYSLIGDYKNAKDKYLSVINESKKEEIIKIAQILLNYLEKFQNEINNINNSKMDTIVKSEKLFKLMDYKNSLELLNSAEPKNLKELIKVQYYKARSYEETGDIKKSIELYQDIITQNPKSDFSKSSNKKILIISTSSENNNLLKKLSDKNNIKIDDKKYLNYSNKINNILVKDNNSLLNTIKLNDYYEKIENDKNDFINTIVNNVVNENTIYTLKNINFYDQIINDLENSNIELEKKNINLKNEKKIIEKQIKNLTIKNELDNKFNKEPEIITNIDQFGRIISKYKYNFNEKGEKYLDSYSIYFYFDNQKLFKVLDYDNNNFLLDYYIIKYDDNWKQIQIQQYDAYGKLIYAK